MGFISGAVDQASKRFGKIIEDKTKRFTVLWSTGEVTETGHPQALKVILNSPSFFNLIQPERNLELFEADPAQLVREILWEKRCLASGALGKTNNRPGAQSTPSLKNTVIGLGVAADAWENSWKKLRKELTSVDSGVGFDGPEFWLTNQDLKIAGEIIIDWGMLSATKDVKKASKVADLQIPNQGESKTAPVGKAKSKPKSVETTQDVIVDPWTTFVERLKNRSIEVLGSQFDASTLLGKYSALEQTFLSLKPAQTEGLVSLLHQTGSSQEFLIGSMLTKSSLEKNKKIGKVAHAQALEILAHYAKSQDSTSSIENSALLRVFLCASGPAAFKEITDGQYGTVFNLLLSLKSDELSAIETAFAQELAKRIKSSPAGSIEGIPEVMDNLPWGSTQRQIVVEALLKQSAPETKTSDFWSGVDIKSVLWLSTLPSWQPLISRPTSRALIQPSLEQTLSLVSHKDCLEALTRIDIIGQVVSQEAIDSLVLRALQANPLTHISLTNLSREAELAELRDELVKTKLSATEVQHIADTSGARVAELLTQVETLSDKLVAAGDQVGRMRDSERLQYELDAAKTLARMLSTLDNELGPDFQGRDRVVSQSGRLGISQIFAAGETETFAPATCDDPEDTAVEGDLVRIIASGFKWSGGDQPVVLVKALVAKI